MGSQSGLWTPVAAQEGSGDLVGVSAKRYFAENGACWSPGVYVWWIGAKTYRSDPLQDNDYIEAQCHQVGSARPSLACLGQISISWKRSQNPYYHHSEVQRDIIWTRSGDKLLQPQPSGAEVGSSYTSGQSGLQCETSKCSA